MIFYFHLFFFLSFCLLIICLCVAFVELNWIEMKMHLNLFQPFEEIPMARIPFNAWFILFIHAMIQRIFIFFFGNSSKNSPLFTYPSPFHTLSAFSHQPSCFLMVWPKPVACLMPNAMENSEYSIYTKVCTKLEQNQMVFPAFYAVTEILFIAMTNSDFGICILFHFNISHVCLVVWMFV